MPIREQGEERNPEFVNRPKDRPSHKRMQREVRSNVNRRFAKMKPSEHKGESLTYSRSPIKRAALDKAVKLAARERKEGRKAGEKYANKVLSRKYEGLSPEERTHMESKYSQDLESDLAGQHREFTNRLGRRSRIEGVQNAHQSELAKQRHKAKQEYRGGLDQLSRDIAMKKQAAAFAIESGEAGQAALDRQQALENARYNQQHTIQRKATKKFNRSFSRI